MPLIKRALLRAFEASQVWRSPSGLSSGFRLLMYHSVGAPLRDDTYGLTVSEADFKQQALTLSKAFSILPLRRDALATAQGATNCCITFDDGFEDNLLAAEILTKLDAPFTIFVTAGFVGKKGFLTGAQLRSLVETKKCQIGAHGFTHKRLGPMTPLEQKNEITDSRKLLEDIIGAPVTTMSYPHGSLSGQTQKLAREAGYELAASSRPGFNAADNVDWYHLRRSEIRPEDVGERFEHKIAGGADYLDSVYKARSFIYGKRNLQWIRY